MGNILVYGDSNSHGTTPLRALGQFERYAPGVPWPDVMAKATGHHVICEGLPGRTTVHEDVVDGGARNGAAVLPAVLLSHVPLDLVVIMLGTNDLKPRFATSAFDIALSVQRLVQMTRGILPDVAVLIAAPVPVVEAGVLVDAFAGAEARQVGLEAHLEAVATRLGASFIRAGAFLSVSSTDGVHWEAKGHAAFGAAIADVVGGILGATPAKPAGGLPKPDITATPPVTLDRLVPPDWADYNGHMNEAFYLTAFTEATDQVLDWAGMDAECVGQGFSIFTVETHIRHLAEVNIGDRLTATTQVIEGGGKKLHTWTELFVDGTLRATAEQFLLHMDLNARATALPRGDVADWLGALKAAHAGLPMPDGFGRHVAQRTDRSTQLIT